MLVFTLLRWAEFGRVYCGCYCCYCCCHFVWKNLLIVGFRSVYGILDLSGVRSKADLAAESALSFPLAPMWLGVQHIIISFLFDIESNLLNSLMIRGFWIFLFLNDSKTESESENIINFLCLLFEMMLRARSIAWASAVKIELYKNIDCIFIIFFLLRNVRKSGMKVRIEDG